MPPPNRATAAQALECVEQIQTRFQPISLKGEEYVNALRHAEANGITGGAVYDLLIATCAAKANADRIYTWNQRHFERLGAEIARRLASPDSAAS